MPPATLTTCCWRLWTTTSRRPTGRRCARLSPRATWRSLSRLTTWTRPSSRCVPPGRKSSRRPLRTRPTASVTPLSATPAATTCGSANHWRRRAAGRVSASPTRPHYRGSLHPPWGVSRSTMSYPAEWGWPFGGGGPGCRRPPLLEVRPEYARKGLRLNSLGWSSSCWRRLRGVGLASIDRTAYPRFNRVVSGRELAEAFTPTDRGGVGRGRRRTTEHLLAWWCG